nr:hypothetical protein [Tanacetum cinerariifolium]
ASSTNTTPIVDKTDKYAKLIIDGKVSLVDDDGKLLKKVAYSDDHDIEDEVESVDNDLARCMASERVGFGTTGQETPDKIHSICDNLDITVRGRKKK